MCLCDPVQADIMMVTAGEIAPPAQDVLNRLDHAKAEEGLEVHGLLVGRRVEAASAVIAPAQQQSAAGPTGPTWGATTLDSMAFCIWWHPHACMQSRHVARCLI